MKRILIEITYNPDLTLQREIIAKVQKIEGISKIMILRYSQPDHPEVIRGY